jgi:hypothetical protein
MRISLREAARGGGCSALRSRGAPFAGSSALDQSTVSVATALCGRRLVFPPIFDWPADAYRHFMKPGWKLGYQPNPFFDVAWHRSKYGCRGNPLLDYIRIVSHDVV